jgi:hypothetical protein
MHSSITPNQSRLSSLRSLRPLVQSPFLLATFLALAGCSGERLDLLPVSGQVTYDGQPLTTGTVSYHIVGGTGHVPTGSIDKDGRYSLSTNYQPGAPPGKYKVIVHATEPVEAIPGKASPGMPKSIIPERYNQPTGTPFEIEVKPDPAAGAYNLRLEK